MSACLPSTFQIAVAENDEDVDKAINNLGLRLGRTNFKGVWHHSSPSCDAPFHLTDLHPKCVLQNSSSIKSENLRLRESTLKLKSNHTKMLMSPVHTGL